jgi:hypothetical protein
MQLYPILLTKNYKRLEAHLFELKIMEKRWFASKHDLFV